MEDEVTRHPSSPREDPSSPEGSPSFAFPPIEQVVNTMTPDDHYKNPKPDSGWLYFRARPKRTLFGDYLSNVKGWKKKFFFVSGDNWEFPEGFAREAGAPKVPRLWGTLGKHCNKVPKLFGDEQKRFNKILSSVGGDLYSAKMVLRLKTFCQSFRISLKPMGEGNDVPTIGAAPAKGDKGESRHSQNEHPQSESPRGASIECLGEIRKEMRRLLPHVPDLALLRCLKKLGQNLKGSKSKGSTARFAPAKGVFIGEKQPRNVFVTSPGNKESTTLPNKKGKIAIDPKGREPTPPLGAKKAKPINVASSRAILVPKSGECSSANPTTVLGPRASFLGSPSMAEKMLSGVVPPEDKKKAMVFGSSLAIRSRDARDEVTLQHGRVASLESVVAYVQKLAEAQVHEQQAVDELAKMKDAQDAIADKLAKSEILVAELHESVVRSKKLAVEAFKSSDEFLDAVEATATKYFGEGFDFCKRQLHRHHPDLAIDLEGMSLDHDLLDEEEWEGEQGEVEEEKEEKKKEDKATSPFSP
ncbi:hypothetical protein Acr_00g0061240 [Actinidia rufa]|uniref:Uncharacterized protein n=1 Tax=Actinidia rufa TaxID=165716 RepID=A0A7J0DNL5_9ERIC|nr:hypothetical protein Acr_00g0061240 [Actinidia rufa]